jgi:DNA-binding NarL/FixJ family response regulator
MTLERLTATEARVAGLLASGYADCAIRAELNLPPQELEDHRARIFGKLGVHSRTELMFLLGTDLPRPASRSSSARGSETR